MITYPIHEIFLTFQGEGTHLGLPAFFVRTYGCPVHCTFCDAAGTWHKDWVPDGILKLSSKEIADYAFASGAPRVVITGGEPAIFDLAPLALALRPLEVHLETSGAFPIQGLFDWVMLSPKRAKEPIAGSVLVADEFKLIIEAPEDIDFFVKMLLRSGMRLDDKRHIWLHPEWSQRENPEVLKAIAEKVKRSHNFRAGWQLHKLYRVDALDPRSRPLVPLGGQPDKGY